MSSDLSPGLQALADTLREALPSLCADPRCRHPEHWHFELARDHKPCLVSGCPCNEWEAS